MFETTLKNFQHLYLLFGIYVADCENKNFKKK